MNASNRPIAQEGMGYLVVKVSTALGAVPLAGASVIIRDSTDGSPIRYSLVTDTDGLTERVPLPAPPRSLSEAPPTSDALPYGLYIVEVFADGYADRFYRNVAIFEGITSVQPVLTVPLTEGANPDSSDGRRLHGTGGQTV
ncbi:MAG: hypothetical protein E7664_00855 [Ruminococcaceae bacterium]|nr:hypothetical protein [Oscillospiraceae bacterium]